jgi:hypothetical protein
VSSHMDDPVGMPPEVFWVWLSSISFSFSSWLMTFCCQRYLEVSANHITCLSS